MNEEKTIVIGDFIELTDREQFDLSSTLRLKAGTIDRGKLWFSKDCSTEFMGNIWSLYVDTGKGERIKTVLHSVCVELMENTLKYGCRDRDYLITMEFCLKKDEFLVYIVNESDPGRIPDLENCARLVLNTDDINQLFKQKLREAKAAKEEGKSKSQLGFIRIVMQKVKLAWQIKMDSKAAVVTTLARISLSTTDGHGRLHPD
ncbi:MAG: hypothetical protein GY737_31790 [Desulfobacteraceae bacterium]|nr:hypothetical protein [Desulfobacteraceae bacterium]